MRLFILSLALLTPFSLLAATVDTNRSIEITTTPDGNLYLAGGDVRIQIPLPQDLLVAAGTLKISEAVEGDVSALGGTIDITAPIAGDLRAAAGHITISEAVEGDVAVFGSFIRVAAPIGEANIAGGSIEFVGGAEGPVSLYGGTVALGGEFNEDVHVVASDRIIVLPGTVITGTLTYNAPQETVIPENAVIEGGVKYVGSAAFLPTAEEAQSYALLGLGIFFAVRVIAAMLMAGLVVGLFRPLAQAVVSRVVREQFRGFIKVFILGLAVLLLVPFDLMLLLMSFVGIGVACVLGAAFVLALLLSYVYGATSLGYAVLGLSRGRSEIIWQDALLGVFLLFALGLIPVIGFLTFFILFCAALGALVLHAYNATFRS